MKKTNTRFKLTYLLLLLEAVFFASLFGGTVPYAFLFLLLLLPLLSLSHLLLLRRFAEPLLAAQTERIVRGTPTQLGALMRNRSVLPAPAVAMVVRSHSEQRPQQQVFRFAVDARGQAQAWVPMLFNYRGLYRFSLERAVYFDLWNILRLGQKVGSVLELVVYPHLYPIENLRRCPILSEREERFLRRGWEETGLYSDVRGYRPGDAQTRIHWKLSANKNDLISKVYETSDDDELLIWLDLHRCGEANALDLEERVIEMALSAMDYCLRRALPFTLCYRQNGELVTCDGRTAADFERIYTTLATVPFDPAVNLTDFARVQMPVRETLVFGVSPDPDALGCLLDNPNRRVQFFCADDNPARWQDLPQHPALQLFSLPPDQDIRKILEG